MSEEVSALDIADQIWAIWAMAKRGEDPNEGAIRGGRRSHDTAGTVSSAGAGRVRRASSQAPS